MNTLASFTDILGWILGCVGLIIGWVGSINLFGFSLLNWFIGLSIFGMISTFVGYIIHRSLDKDIENQTQRIRSNAYLARKARK